MIFCGAGSFEHRGVERSFCGGVFGQPVSSQDQLEGLHVPTSLGAEQHALRPDVQVLRGRGPQISYCLHTLVDRCSSLHEGDPGRSEGDHGENHQVGDRGGAQAAEAALLTLLYGGRQRRLFFLVLLFASRRSRCSRTTPVSTSWVSSIRCAP